jgi:hypothetical protein
MIEVRPGENVELALARAERRILALETEIACVLRVVRALVQRAGGQLRVFEEEYRAVEPGSVLRSHARPDIGAIELSVGERPSASSIGNTYYKGG